MSPDERAGILKWMKFKEQVITELWIHLISPPAIRVNLYMGTPGSPLKPQLPTSPMRVIITSCLLWQRWLADPQAVLLAFQSVEIAGRGSPTRSAFCFASHWEEPLCSSAWNAWEGNVPLFQTGLSQVPSSVSIFFLPHLFDKC